MPAHKGGYVVEYAHGMARAPADARPRRGKDEPAACLSLYPLGVRATGAGLLLLLAADCAEPVKKETPRAPLASASTTAVASVPSSSAAPSTTESTVAIVDAGPPQCPPGIDGGVVDFFVKREVLPPKPPDREKALPGIILTAPSLNLKIELVSIPAPMSCGTSILAAAQRMSVSCTFSPSSFTFGVRREPDRITFTETDVEIAAPPSASKEFHPPILIPCGTRLAFHHFEWRDPKWSAFGPPCQVRCSDQEWACRRPCLTNLTDENGTLTDAGTTCDTKCREATAKCTARCAQ